MLTKAIEAEAFKDFCEIGGALLSSDFVQKDKPDFWHLTQPIGVELTFYRRDAHQSNTNGSPRRRWEAQLETLLDQVRADYNAVRTRRIEVYVHPRRTDAVTFPKSARIDLLNLIVLRAADVDQPIPPSLLSIVDDVSAGYVEWWQDDPWQMVLADFVDVEVDAVQACLDEKESKVASYRQSFSEVCLLVHGSPSVYVGAPEFGRWSTCGHVTRELIRTTFRSSFDRVYYLDQDQRRCVQLTISP